MNQEKQTKFAGTTRKAEEAYLAKTLQVIRDNVAEYGSEVARMQEDIDVMLQHYHDNDTEVLTILNNTVTMHTHMKRALERNEKALKKPYFGRIDFHDEALDKNESLYIGRGGISKDTTHWMVVDWRAPVANAYYENGLGKCSYAAPGGTQLQIDLKLKRTYEMEDGKLLDYFDSEVIANDELLTKYLAKNKQAVLGEIIATIQKEQNDIIRKTPYHNIIVQGVAGSGKTTVAMHRISYILYNYAERFKPDDFYIVGSNRILLDYITGVLPDLDVYGIRQMTMEQLFVRLLYEDWDEKQYRILEGGRRGKGDEVRGTAKWFQELDRFCRRLEWRTIPREAVFLNPRQFVEGLRDGKPGVYDETKGERTDPKTLICLVPREAIERYIQQNPTISVQSKIDMLNERLLIKIKEEFLYRGIRFTEAEQKAILKAYRGHYGARRWKRSIYDLYRAFLQEQTERGYKIDIPETEFDVYDLAALAYLYKRVKETEVISEAHHIVIDEAQDFGMMAYASLHACIGGCTYTIMGDVSQNIHFGYGLNDWEELRELLLTDEQDSFGILKKSYRNTVEISEFATNILHHGRFSSYPVEPIIRHGEAVAVKKEKDRETMFAQAAQVCRQWQEKGLDTIAVVCRDRESAKQAAQELGKYISVGESDLEKAVFTSGVMVLPVTYTKGLEFDAVLILDPVREEYPNDDGHAKLLYVAATRALHELCVLYTGDLTGLIADPLPKRRTLSKPGTVRKSEETPAAESRTPRGRSNARKPAAPGAAPVSGKRISIVRNPAETETATGRYPASVSSPAPAKPAISRPTMGGFPVPARSMSGTTPATAPGNRVPNIIPPGSSRTLSTFGPSEKKADNAAARRQTAERPAGTLFGDLPPTEKLRPVGHAKIDLAVRWVTKQPDGLYLQSRYGILRLSPVGSAIIRVTFARGAQLAQGTHPGIAVRRTDKAWKYKESSKFVELTTAELTLRIDRATGAVSYLNRENRLLLAENGRESRQVEFAVAGKSRSWLFLDWKKGEKLYGLGTTEKGGIQLRGTARYISNGPGAEKLPFLLSDQGYGILAATQSPVIFCDIPVYGSYLSVENEAQMDFYFIAGKQQNTILNAYAYLCGRL